MVRHDALDDAGGIGSDCAAVTAGNREQCKRSNDRAGQNSVDQFAFHPRNNRSFQTC